jgi:O-Antigen ligase
VLKAPRLREAAAHAFVVLAFLAVPLAASSRFAEQFTSVKWHVLEALGLAWFVAERLRGPVLPSFSRRTALALAALVVLVVAGSLRQGPAWAMQPLLARTGFALVALASLAYFRRTGLALGPLRAAVAVACAVVLALGFLQLAGLVPLPWLTAGDQVSATFGNVNMAAQFVALALVILMASVGEGAEPGLPKAAVAALGSAGLVYLHLLGARSAPLALAGALAFLLLVHRKTTLLRVAVVGVMLVAVLRFLPGAAGPPRSGATSAHKRQSIGLRLSVWSDTLRLVRERPLGVGAGNFEQAFVPYALGGRSRPDESLVFRSPHNEYLRLLAEEGLLASALLAALLLGLARALARSPAISSWRSPPGRLLGSAGIFLGIEAFFQFPFEMAFPSLTAAVALGLAGACLVASAAAPRTGVVGRVVLLAAIAGFSWALARVVMAELLWVRGMNDVHAQERACRLDPRRLDACTNGAWLRILSGDHGTGREALVNVLERAPHYLPAIKLLGEESMARGDRETGCRYLGLYDALFDGKSALHDRLLRECPREALEEVRRLVAIPLYRKFPFAAADRVDAPGAVRRVMAAAGCAGRHLGAALGVPVSPEVNIKASHLGLCLALLGPSAHAEAPQPPAPLPSPLPLFPPDNWWNVNVTNAPTDSNSASFIDFIGGGTALHPDFGPDDGTAFGTYGMIYAVVPGTQPLEFVDFSTGYPTESDWGAPGRPWGYPIPVGARTQPRWIEGGQPGGGPSGDRHMILVDRDNRILYELYAARWNAGLGRWQAASGAVFMLDGNGRRPDGWTSADAAGLAILPGLVRYDEVFGPDPIRHALRMTVDSTNGHVFPASHTASSSSSPNALPMGARLRLKPGTSLSGYPPYIQKIFQAMKTYGLIVADNGSDMYITGAYDTRWNNDVLNPAFASLHASDFEVIERGWRPPVATSTGGLDFHTLAPCRILDTRLASGSYGGPALLPTAERVVVATGRCGIPASAQALSLNVTAVSAPGTGHLRLYPGNATAPLVATVNYSAGQTRGNNAIVMLASSGTGTFAVKSFTPAGAVHVVVDVNGYFE